MLQKENLLVQKVSITVLVVLVELREESEEIV